MLSWLPQNITFEDVLDKKTELEKLSNITETDIQDIWIRSGEARVAEYVYSFEGPLYVKMVFRFRNTIHEDSPPSPSFFFNGLDPGNRNKLLQRFDLGDYIDVMHFFVWIRSSFSRYTTEQISRKTSIYVPFESFTQMNEIKFFLALPETVQRHIVKKYEKYNTKFLATV